MPRVALLGFMPEPNGFAPMAEFRQKPWLEGDALLADVRNARPHGPCWMRA